MVLSQASTHHKPSHVLQARELQGCRSLLQGLQDAKPDLRLQVSFAISTAAEEAAAAAQKPASKKRARPSG